MKVYYRYEVRRYAAPLDEFDNPCGTGRVELELHAYRVAKETPKGVRLAIGRFVLASARKRFACATVDEAWQSFQARKRRQVSILSAQLSDARAALDMQQSSARDCTQWTGIMLTPAAQQE